MAIDRKYGTVTLEHGDIAADEPVVVFRAKDRLLPEVLAFYRGLCADSGSPDRHLDLIGESASAVVRWQAEHGNKVPDSESSRAWLGE